MILKGNLPKWLESILPTGNPKELRLGWIIYEEIGKVVINDYATGKIKIGPPDKYVDPMRKV